MDYRWCYCRGYLEYTVRGTVICRRQLVVYQILLQGTADGKAETHVDEFKAMNDGWGAFEKICIHFKGADARQPVITAARKQLRNLFFTKDSPEFKFETYCIGHNEANADL
jgi:hypothetical protein